MMKMSTICMLNIRRKRSRQQVEMSSSSQHCSRMASLNCTRMHAPIQHSFMIVVSKISWHRKNATRPHPVPTSTPFKNHLHHKCAKLSPNGSSRWVSIFFNGVICVRVVKIILFLNKKKTHRKGEEGSKWCS